MRWALHDAESVAWAVFVAAVLLVHVTTLDSAFSLPKLAVLSTGLPVLALVRSAALRRPDAAGPPLGLTVCAGVLVAWWLAVSVGATHSYTSFWGVFDRFNGFWTLASLLATTLLVGSLVRTPDTALRWLRTGTWLLVVMALVSLGQALGLDPRAWSIQRPVGTVGHPVPLAALLGMGAVVSLCIPAHLQRRATSLAVAAVLAMGCASTWSRGPMLGVLAALGVLAFLKAPPAWRRVVSGAVAVATLAAIALGVHLYRHPDLAPRVFTDGRGFAVTNRFTYYEAAARLVRQRPWRGHGLEHFAVAYPTVRPVEGEAIGPDIVPTMVHSGPLEWLVGAGGVGLVLWFAWVGIAAASAARAVAGGSDSARALGTSGLLALAVYIVQDLSGWRDLSLDLSVAVLFGCLGCLATFRLQRNATSALFGAVALAALLPADHAWWQVRATSGVRAVINSAPLDGQALEAAAAAVPGESRHLLSAARAAQSTMARGLASQEAYDLCVRLLDEAVHDNPHDPYIRSQRIALEADALERGMRWRGGVSDAQLAAMVDADPNNATMHHTAARYLLVAGRPEEALRAVARARQLRPTLASGAELQARVLLALDRIDAAEAAATEAVALAAGQAPMRARAVRTLAAVHRRQRAVSGQE